MKTSRIILLLLIPVFILGTVSAQKTKKADKRMLYFAYADAVPMLEKIIEKDKKGKEQAMAMLADCYRMMNDPENAELWYAQTIEQEGIDPINYYYYGQTLRSQGRYEEARAQFLKYDSLVPDDPRGAIFASFSRDVEPWLELPDRYTVINVNSVNTEYSDFSPVFYKQGILLSSDRKGEVLDDETFDWTGTPYLDFYFAKLSGSMEPFLPMFMEQDLFSKDLAQTYHDGTAVFTKDGNKIYFTRTIRERVKKDDDRIVTNILKIYSSEYVDDEWSDLEPFYLNNDIFSVGHPSLSPNDSILYFVSDMPGGYGGTDIYYCEMDSITGWDSAVNLGPEVNTFANEMFPFMDTDGTLYFSSAGHPGYGDLDIYKTSLKDTLWSVPENMMAPMNSSYDDFGIALYKEGNVGLFSSNRPGGAGGDDIYAYESLEMPVYLAGHVVVCRDRPVYVSGYVKDRITNTPISDAVVFVLNKETDLVTTVITDINGYYSLEVEPDATYVIKTMKKGHLSDCMTAVIADESPDLRDLLLDRFEVNKVFVLDDIYYDFDKWNIRPDAAIELDGLVYIMNENPITIELSSHTDSRGSDSYNEALSQRRAEAAVSYLISQGIEASRMTAKGYGEYQLINQCSNGVQCTDEQHQANRRTEFKITSVGEQHMGLYKPLASFESGEVIELNYFDDDFYAECDYFYPEIDENVEAGLEDFCDIPVINATVFVLNTQTNKVEILKTDATGRFETRVDAGATYIVKAKKAGYLSDCLMTGVIEESLLTRDLVLEKYEVEMVFELENIYYDLDKWYIRPDAEPALDDLVRIMKENPIIIELSAHTDSRGSDQYNMELSQKRAESAVRYIILQGISPASISAKGYGETMLVNHCENGVKCTDEEHQMNRRTEFMITGITETKTGSDESLDRYIPGDSWDKFQFEPDFFSNCLFSEPISLGEDIYKDRFADNVEGSEEEVMEVVVEYETGDGDDPGKGEVISIVDIEETPGGETEVEIIVVRPEIEEQPEKITTPVQGYYTVQIASGDINLSRFRDVEDPMKCTGIDGIYRIIAGVFESKTDANQYRDQLKSLGYKDAWVVMIDNNRINCVK